MTARWLLGAAVWLAVGPAAAQGGGGATFTHRPAPAFSVKDVLGKVASPKRFLGRPAVLFVFCSCLECKRIALDWARIQREAAPRGRVATVVAYAGSRPETVAFGAATKLDPATTTLIEDGGMAIARVYRAMPCPTVFVLDAKGIVRYASKEAAGELEASSSVLLGQTLAALRRKGGAPAAAVAPSKAGPALSAVDTAEVEVDGGEFVWRPVGVDLDKPTVVSHTFRFANRSKRTIDVAQVLASCGCEETTLIQGGKPVRTAALKPGEAVSLRVAVRLPGNGASKTVSVWLYSKAVQPVGSVKIVVGP